MVADLTADVDETLRVLAGLYGEGRPATGHSTVMMRDIAAGMRAQSASGLAGYTEALGAHTVVADSQSRRDGTVHTSVARSGDGTVVGRQQLAHQLTEFRTRVQALVSVGDARFSGPALLDTAQRSIAQATRQVTADLDAARRLAAQIMPPTVAPPRPRTVPAERRVRRRRRIRPVAAALGAHAAPPRGPRQQSDGTPGGAAVSAASGWLGTPYVWGGGGANGPSGGGFDCSGLTQYAVAQATGGDVVLPRTTYEQIYSGIRIHPSDAQPGDLVFPGNSFSTRGPEHVQLAAGGGKVIEAPYAGARVRWSDMDRNSVVVRVL
ncbi:NlpC/P60 family protein [Nocardia otitidiscaviarum]|uniref:NlpC/P60 family protein n=1 Tax=Nocardia otitidiscaviarum TaxID=1823 RepID=A0A516NGR8_9NOCA|nr:NlpC/P60 family protein [Nocardia otitidiscaviarum]